MRAVSLALIAGLGSAALSACGTGQPSVGETVRSQYDPSLMVYAASRGGIPVEISGEAFSATQESVDATVTDSLTRATGSYQVPFSTRPAAGTQDAYRVVMTLNPAKNAPTHRICQSNIDSTGVAGENVRVAAALCASDQAVTRVSGQVDGATSPDSDAFRNLVTQVGHGLFPPFNRDRNAEGFDR